MDEKDFEVLTDLAATCNISRSSHRLFTTQSAITKRLQKIEEELGIQLFVRSKKGLLPAPALEGLLPDLRDAINAVDRMRSFAAACHGEIAGTLHMGIAVNYARYRLPDVLRAYMTRCPRVNIHIKANRSTNVYRDLISGETSLAIVRGEYSWRHGDMVLSEDQHCMVLYRAHENGDLKDIPFIARESDAGYMNELERWFDEQGIHSSRSEVVINDVETIVTLVQRGIGWSVLPGICLNRFDGIIRPITFRNGERFVRRTHILYRSDYMSLPQAKAFVEIAKQYEEKNPVLKLE